VLFRSKFCSEDIRTWEQNTPAEKSLECVKKALHFGMSALFGIFGCL